MEHHVLSLTLTYRETASIELQIQQAEIHLSYERKIGL